MDLLNYLKNEPRARERKNKNRAIGNLVFKQYFHFPGEVPEIGLKIKNAMPDIVAEILSMDRQWRKILEENPDLRGTDYGHKDELEVEKQRQLGYNI